MLAQVRSGPDSGQHQQLRRVEGAAAKDHFPASTHLTALARSITGYGVGPVKVLALEVFDPVCGAARVEQNAGRQGIQLDVQRIRVVLGYLEDALACPDALVSRG
jgi:hypothetical protein